MDKKGDEVKLAFNSGRLWNAPGKPEKCFVGLQAWRVLSGDSPGMSAGLGASRRCHRRRYSVLMCSSRRARDAMKPLFCATSGLFGLIFF